MEVKRASPFRSIKERWDLSLDNRIACRTKDTNEYGSCTYQKTADFATGDECEKSDMEQH